MPFELTILAWGCVLALVHVLVEGNVRTRQYGKAWNMSARDAEMPPPSPLVGRLSRARANYFETFPVVIAALLIIGLLPLSSRLTELGAALWLGARVIYLPLYASGVAVVRTIVWSISFLGIILLLWPILTAGFTI